jgi:hypothetical protein
MPFLDVLLTPAGSAILIPVIIIFMGAVMQKIIKNEPWGMHHWVFGKELALTTFSISIVMLLDWAKVTLGSTSNPVLSVHKYPNFIFVTLMTVVIIVLLLSEYQDYFRTQPNAASTNGPLISFWRMTWLNLLGGLPLIGALYVIVE